MQKTAPKETFYSKNESILKMAKIGHDAKQNDQFGSKIKNAKKVQKTILLAHWSCCVQKTAPKKTLYWKNESILKMAKIGHDAKAIPFAKWSVWVKN